MRWDSSTAASLHLHTVLQVFGGLDALGQLGLETGQRFTRQRRAGLGGVTLPGGGVGQIQRRLGQQCLGLGHPFHGDGVLVLGAAQLVQALAHDAGSALVAGIHFLEHFLQHIVGGRCGQPVTQAGCTVARGFCRKSTASHCIQRVGLGVLAGVGFTSGASDIFLLQKSWYMSYG
jgi:hypothetical protein